jgi:hypothetical protein
MVCRSEIYSLHRIQLHCLVCKLLAQPSRISVSEILLVNRSKLRHPFIHQLHHLRSTFMADDEKVQWNNSFIWTERTCLKDQIEHVILSLRQRSAPSRMATLSWSGIGWSAVIRTQVFPWRVTPSCSQLLDFSVIQLPTGKYTKSWGKTLVSFQL